VRAWWVTRLESIAYVILGAFAMLGFAFLIVLGPFFYRWLASRIPTLEPFDATIALLRYGVATVLIVGALTVAHKFIAAGRRRFWDILPGILVTLCLWLLGGLAFSRYLDNFAGAYFTTYGGLATAMIALVFLYWLAAMFLFGGELNGTLIAAKRMKLGDNPDPARLGALIEMP
jgi:membrane protein